mgnify:CR=1 FL=1
MYCVNCGVELADSETVCPLCGTRVFHPLDSGSLQAIARRLLDFLSGVAYANEGKIKKVAISTYIITPYNVDILGDLIDELENNGMYF